MFTSDIAQAVEYIYMTVDNRAKEVHNISALVASHDRLFYVLAAAAENTRSSIVDIDKSDVYCKDTVDR
jgi:hypothetical protein